MYHLLFRQLYSYLIDVDSFLKSEQNLGPELSMAEELRDTLRTKLMEVESKQMVYDLDEDVKSDDLEEKVSSLNTFMKDLLENIERRLGLTEYYIEVLNHSETVNHSISTIEEDIAERKDHARLLQAPEVPAEVKDQLAKLEQLSNGFKDAANQVRAFLLAPVNYHPGLIVLMDFISFNCFYEATHPTDCCMQPISSFSYNNSPCDAQSFC